MKNKLSELVSKLGLESHEDAIKRVCIEYGKSLADRFNVPDAEQIEIRNTIMFYIAQDEQDLTQ